MAVDVLAEVSRFLAGSVFLMAGLSKLGTADALASTIRKYRLTPRWSDRVLARFLPLLELALAASLILGFGLRAAAAIGAILVALFSFAAATAIARRIDVDCDCFGILYRERIGRTTLIRDAALTAMCVVVAVADSERLLLIRAAAAAEIPRLLLTSVPVMGAGGVSAWVALRARRRAQAA